MYIDSQVSSAVANGRTRRAASRTSCDTRLDGQCDKLAVDRGKYCQLRSTGGGQLYYNERLLRRIQFTTRCYDRHAVANFPTSRV